MSCFDGNTREDCSFARAADQVETVTQWLGLTGYPVELLFNLYKCFGGDQS